MIGRRKFTSSLALGILAPLLCGGAQPAARVYRVGVLFHGSASGSAPHLAAIRDRLHALGYVEGQNLVIESRYAYGQSERLAARAALRRSRERATKYSLVRARRICRE